MTRTNAGRLSNCVPVKVCALVVLLAPEKVGTPAGQLSICVCADPAAEVTALFVTAWVKVALGPAVVPVAEPVLVVAPTVVEDASTQK